VCCGRRDTRSVHGRGGGGVSCRRMDTRSLRGREGGDVSCHRTDARDLCGHYWDGCVLNIAHYFIVAIRVMKTALSHLSVVDGV